MSTFQQVLQWVVKKITNLGTPTNNLDAVNKAYVDSVAQGLDVKQSVRLASTTNVLTTSSGNLSLDGVQVSNDWRILLKDQTDKKENGIWNYKYNAGTNVYMLERPDDFQNPSVSGGAFTFVEAGSTLEGTGWVCTNDGNVNVGVDNILYTQFSGVGLITAGTALSKDNATNTLNVEVYPQSGVEVFNDSLRLNLAHANIAGYLSVVDGGTGRDLLTANHFLIGDGTNAVNLNKVAPSGNVVGDDDTQILKNKNINAFDNTVFIRTDQVDNMVWLYKDIKSAGTNGGTFASGSWQTREINSNVYQYNGDVSRNANVITCAPGKYLVSAVGIARYVDINQMRIYSTDGLGPNVYGPVVDCNEYQSIPATLSGYLNLSSTKSFQLQHRCKIS